MALLTSPPSQTPPCRFPAAGSSGATPLTVPRVCYPGGQQRMVTEEFRISLPRQPFPASSAIEPLPPDATDFSIELPDAPGVRRSPVVQVVAPKLGVEGLLLFLHRLMAVLPAPFGDGRQAPAESFLHGPHVHCELPSPAAGTDVREAEEIERGWFLPLPLRMFLRVSPKVHQPRLLRVERQTVFCKPFR